MTLKELEPQLLALSDAEKIQAVQLLLQTEMRVDGLQPTFRHRGIEKTPGVCGGSACIVGTRVTVWGLVEARRSGYREADLLRSYRSITANDLENAWLALAGRVDECVAQEGSLWGKLIRVVRPSQ
jgi:uncharacterized protein (DUF433 family)